MITTRSLVLHAIALALLGFVCGLSTAEDQAESDLELTIEQLSSGRYEIRQQAFDRLASEGFRAIAAVEATAAQRDLDLEISRRCVEILTAIAQEKESREAALESLDRLGSNAEFLGSSLATKRAFQLRESKQERAVRLLTAAGAQLHHSSRNKEIRYVSGIFRDRECLHLQHLPAVRQVSFSGLGITDKCITYLAKAKSLESVIMMSCSVSDAGLAGLPKLARLRNIHLSGDSFSAAGLTHLGDIPSLTSIGIYSSIGSDELHTLSSISVRSLYLGDVIMSDEVASILANLNGFNNFSLTLKGVANEDLRWVKQSQLHSIRLTITDSPGVTDEGLQHLQAPALRSLLLQKTGISNQGMTTIAEIKSLTSVSVYDSPITDEGVKQLSSLSQLRTLSLRGTQVSDDALSSLQKLMPNLRYVRNRQGARLPVPAQAPAKPPEIVPR